MKPENTKIMILIETMFNDQEFWYPYYRLQEAGCRVTVVGSGSAEVYTGKAGTVKKADAAADRISAADFDGIVIPGGYAPDHMRRYPAMVGLVKDTFESRRLVAAICHAGWMLASAGVLSGRRVTSYFAIKDDLVNAGAHWVDEAVVVDGHLVTSRVPDDLPVFMKAVIEVLARQASTVP